MATCPASESKTSELQEGPKKGEETLEEHQQLEGSLIYAHDVQKAASTWCWIPSTFLSFSL